MTSAQHSVSCVNTADCGRILVTNFALCHGETVLVEDPYVCILSKSKRDLICAYCLKENNSLQRCASCKYVKYCSRTCQKEDWTTSHKLECRYLKRVLPRSPPDLARLLSHLIWKTQSQTTTDATAKPQPAENILPTGLSQLESHHERLSEQRKQHLESLSLVLSQYLEGDVRALCEPETLVQMFGAVMCNSFSVCDNDLNSVGVGIYLRASMLNHSCDPSCVAVFDGRRLQVRTIKDLKAGEECTISYVDLLTSPAEIKAELLQRYHFTCHCSRCTTDLAKGISEEWDGTAVAELQTCLKEVEAAKASLDWSTVLHLCEPCLHPHGSSPRLQPNHPLIVKLRDAAFDACLETQAWEKAAIYGLENTSPYRHHYGPYHPSLGVHLIKVGKLLLYIEKVPEAWRYLTEAESVLEVTHGKTHSLMLTLKELLGSCR